MKKLIILFFTLLMVLNSFAQGEDETTKIPKLSKDAATKKILDKISAKAESYETMRLKFIYDFEDIAKKENNEKEGIVYIKKDKYKLFLKNTGVEVMFDGKTKASYSRSETTEGEVIEEVTYTTPDSSDTDFLNPVNIYSFYEKNFYYAKIGNEKVNGKEMTIIDFIPENREITLSKIRLTVNESTNEIYSAKSFAKDGKRLTITITELKPNITIAEKLFTFDEAANPNCEVIDLRD